MTLEEKVSLLYGQTSMDLRPIARLGIPSLKLADGPLGIRWDQSTAFPCTIALGATWDVDLVRFCKLFLDRLEKSERVNLLVVGKLIRMAYTVHLLKSTNTLLKAQAIEEADEGPVDDDYHEWMEDDETFRVTTGIISNREVLVESLLHQGDRPVTLLDLLDALEEVEDEVNLLRESRHRHREAEASIDLKNRGEINAKVFTENVEEAIKLTWQRVNQFNGHPIPFTDLKEGFELDSTTTFISLLYLAKLSRVLLSQRSFPKGEI